MFSILTSFRVLRAPESWLKHFFQPFSTFFIHLNLFQWFHGRNQQKTSEKEQKNVCFLFFAFSSKLVDMQKLVDSLRGYPEIVFFQLIFLQFLMFFSILWLFSDFFVIFYVFWVKLMFFVTIFKPPKWSFRQSLT